MNNGFFSFPSVADNRLLEVKQFDSSGLYVVPPNAKKIQMFAVGAGGGAGGGRRSASARGGGSGSGGSIVLEEYFIEDLGPNSILSIIIGAGGAGGAGGSTDNASGTSGTIGGNTTIGAIGLPGFFIISLGGAAGGGGGPFSATAGAGRTAYFYGRQILSASQGGGGSSSSASILRINYISIFGYHGGGGGSGHISGVANTGGGIYANLGLYTTTASIGPIKYARGATVRAEGAINSAIRPDDLYENILGIFSPGYGGPGGSGGLITSASPGGNGYRGGGGGGGGGSNTGIAAGAGGSGGNGYVAIAVYE